jgi:hypothetical protein
MTSILKAPFMEMSPKIIYLGGFATGPRKKILEGFRPAARGCWIV